MPIGRHVCNPWALHPGKAGRGIGIPGEHEALAGQHHVRVGHVLQGQRLLRFGAGDGERLGCGQLAPFREVHVHGGDGEVRLRVGRVDACGAAELDQALPPLAGARELLAAHEGFERGHRRLVA